MSRAEAAAAAVGNNNLVLGIGFPGKDGILWRREDGESLDLAGNRGDANLDICDGVGAVGEFHYVPHCCCDSMV